jgi:lipopolysaccharide biosynthesis regulator YciM
VKKKAFIFSTVAVAMAVLLFTLPKVVVDNDSDEASSAMDSKEASSTSAHPSVSSLSYEEVDSLTALLEDAGTAQQDKTILLKRLAEVYMEAMIVDTACLYADKLSVLTQSTEDIKRSLEFHYERFTFASDQSKAVAAGEQVRNWFEKIPEEVRGYQDLKTKAAMTWVATEQPMNGIMMLREVLEKEPEHREATFNLGVLAMQSGQYTRAIDRFSTLVKRDSSDVQSLFYLALSQKQSGNTDLAQQLFVKVKSIETDPSVLATVETYLKEIESTQ